MTAKRPLLVSPPPGSAVAKLDSELVISVAASSTWKQGLLVFADESTLLTGAGAAPGAKVMRTWEHDGRIYISIKKLGGWSRGHVLVQISNDDTGCSVNQYFFIRGAALLPPSTARGVGRVPGGYFWQEPTRWSVAGRYINLPCDMPEGTVIGPGCVYYKSLGLVGWVDGDQWHSAIVPQNHFSDLASIKMMAVRGSYALVALDSAGGITVVCNDKMHYWPQANACQIGVTDGWIHANQYVYSAHIPWAYAAYPMERTLENWWTIEADEPTQSREHIMLWGEDVHVWYSRRELIAHAEPDPIMGRSDGILWADQDFGEAISTVELLGGHYALINGRMIANLKNPSVEELS